MLITTAALVTCAAALLAAEASYMRRMARLSLATLVVDKVRPR